MDKIDNDNAPGEEEQQEMTNIVSGSGEISRQIVEYTRLELILFHARPLISRYLSACPIHQYIGY